MRKIKVLMYLLVVPVLLFVLSSCKKGLVSIENKQLNVDTYLNELKNSNGVFLSYEIIKKNNENYLLEYGSKNDIYYFQDEFGKIIYDLSQDGIVAVYTKEINDLKWNIAFNEINESFTSELVLDNIDELYQNFIFFPLEYLTYTDLGKVFTQEHISSNTIINF